MSTHYSVMCRHYYRQYNFLSFHILFFSLLCLCKRVAFQPVKNRRCWPISAAIFSVGLLPPGLCQGRAGRACAPGAPEGLGLDICEQDKLWHGVRGFFPPDPCPLAKTGGLGGRSPPCSLTLALALALASSAATQRGRVPFGMPRPWRRARRPL